jgi:hypothetical protein
VEGVLGRLSGGLEPFYATELNFLSRLYCVVTMLQQKIKSYHFSSTLSISKGLEILTK